MSIVYMAINTFNNKRYIGVTSYSLDRRSKQHINCAMSNKNGSPLFYRAIRKHGAESFIWSILCEYETAEEAWLNEPIFIKNMKPEYNIASGGEGSVGVRHSDEWKRNMSEKKKGKKLSAKAVQSLIDAYTPERKKRMSEFMTGRVMSAESREKWRLSYKDKGFINQIMCLEDGKIHKNASECAIFYNINKSGVSSVCCGRYCSSGGLHFIKYKNDLTTDERKALIYDIEERSRIKRKWTQEKKDNFINKMSGRKRPKHIVEKITMANKGKKRSQDIRNKLSELGKKNIENWNKYRSLGPKASAKKVICLNDGAVYESASSAARAYNLCRSSIASVCLGKRKTSAKMKFEYIGES